MRQQASSPFLSVATSNRAWTRPRRRRCCRTIVRQAPTDADLIDRRGDTQSVGKGLACSQTDGPPIVLPPIPRTWCSRSN